MTALNTSTRSPRIHRCPYCMTLPCLQILLKISNHLELMKPDPRDPPEKQEKDRAFAAMALGADAHLIGGTEAESSFMGLSDTQHCGKMRALESLLEDWKAQGDKVREADVSRIVLSAYWRCVLLLRSRTEKGSVDRLEGQVGPFLKCQALFRSRE